MKKQFLWMYNVLRNLSLLLLLVVAFALMSSYYLPSLIQPVTNRICQLSGNPSIEDGAFMAFNISESDGDDKGEQENEEENEEDSSRLNPSSRMRFSIRNGEVFLDPDEIMVVKKVKYQDSLIVRLTNDTMVYLFEKDLALRKVCARLEEQKNGSFLSDRFMIVNADQVFKIYGERHSGYSLEFRNGLVEDVTESLYAKIRSHYSN